MKRVFCLLVFGAMLTGCGNNTAAPAAETDLIGALLHSRGQTRETACFDKDLVDPMLAQQALVQAHFKRYWKSPWEFPKFVYGLADANESVSQKVGGLYDLFTIGTIRTGHRVTGIQDFAPVFEPKTGHPLIEALGMLYERCETTLSEAEKENVEALIRNTPAEIQLALAKLVYAAGEAKYYRDRALRDIPKERWPKALEFAQQAFNPKSEFEGGDIINWDFGLKIDFDDLYTGGLFPLTASLQMEKFLNQQLVAIKEMKPKDEQIIELDIDLIDMEFDTPLGKVAFRGKKEDNTYNASDYLLIIDLAGKDTYNGSAGASWKLEHPVSTVIDWSGDDSYLADEKTPCAQGAGILGYGFLFDHGGNDTFRAFDNAQGMCYFGVGFLWVDGGDDSFEGRYAAQGSASFGVAGLVKSGGSDKYYACYTSQGFGFTGGYGFLIDRDGNDTYIAEPYKLFSPAKGGHDNMRNYNFCQGAGWGQRGDLSGGHSMAGGTGILQDLSGDDSYQCGVYGQATGYWYGTGILHDKKGNDKYEGSFFVQSGTAHMGLTMFLDEEGNDTYHVWHAISLAGAHDLSVSWFIDKGGDDTTSSWEWKDKEGEQTLEESGIKDEGGGTLIGSAITTSIAIYLNIEGNDTYRFYSKDSFAWCLHRAPPSSWRYDINNIAMFIDLGGKDNYDLKNNPPDDLREWGKVGNNTAWKRITSTKGEEGNPDKTFSIGIDTTTGKIKEVR
ncbi:MAG: hypothetical protein HY811_12060 [Planctomycetes bacterium]|nr:hypothetical protein [Planctomycetota bacterium]